VIGVNPEVLGMSLTITAVIISIYNTILFYKQSKLVEKQALLQRSEVYPYLRLKEANVIENKFKLNLENMANIPAFQLGLFVNFIPCSTYKEGHWQFVNEVVTSDPKMEKGCPERAVVPLRNERGVSRLYGKENDIYTAEPVFLFKNIKKVSEGVCLSDNFKRLKERLGGQGIRFVAVMIALVYKDVAETVNEFEPIKDFIVDFQKHNNIEEAYNEGIPFYDKTIGYEELPYQDYETYRLFKSYRGFLEES